MAREGLPPVAVAQLARAETDVKEMEEGEADEATDAKGCSALSLSLFLARVGGRLTLTLTL
jgi:hypothetical protein